MKPIERRALLSVVVLGAIFPACRGAIHDRQMVYTKPRVAPVRVDTSRGARVKSSDVNAKAAPRPQIPASAGVDVPMFEPE